MDVTTVFLSSTGKDLHEYRDAVYEAIHRMDDYRCVRYEYAGARHAKPVEFCRGQVRKCDVYVGLIGHLYGSCPPGEEKSFTEIEYDTATEDGKVRLLFIASNRVHVEPDLMEDSEKQQKQKAFQARIDEDRVRGRFSEPQELAKLVIIGLRNWEREKAKPEEHPEATEKPTAEREGGQETRQISEDAVSTPGDEAARQRLEAITVVQNALGAGDPDAALSGGGALGNLNIARFFLTAKTMFSKHCAREYLTIHEVNLLYAHRNDLKIRGSERFILWDTMLGHGNDVVPGWYWLGPAISGSPGLALWSFALHDPFEDVREHAVNILRKARILPEVAGREPGGVDVCERMMNDGSPSVRRAFLDYLGELGTQEHLILVDKALEDQDSSLHEPALRAKWSIKARSDTNATFVELMDFDDPPSEGMNALRENLQNLSSEVLSKAISHKNHRLRELAVKTLVQHNALSKETGYALLNDDSLAVRAWGYKSLIDKGERFSSEDIRDALEPPSEARSGPLGYWFAFERAEIKPDDVVYSLYRSYSYNELLESLDWIDVDGPVVYRVLSEYHFDQFSDRLHIDLSDSFQSFKNECLQRIRDHIRETVCTWVRERIPRRDLAKQGQAHDCSYSIKSD